MAIYWFTPGFKGRTFKLCVLTRWDFNFCVRSSPLRGRVRVHLSRASGLAVSDRLSAIESEAVFRMPLKEVIKWEPNFEDDFVQLRTTETSRLEFSFSLSIWDDAGKISSNPDCENVSHFFLWPSFCKPTRMSLFPPFVRLHNLNSGRLFPWNLSRQNVPLFSSSLSSSSVDLTTTTLH